MEIGDIVICVDDFFNVDVQTKIPNRPKRGLIYMIREIINHREKNLIGLRLEELHNPQIEAIIEGRKTFVEPSFKKERFSKISVNLNMEEIFSEVEIQLEN